MKTGDAVMFIPSTDEQLHDMQSCGISLQLKDYARLST